MPDPVPVRLAIQIRWRDLDALGHVNNAVYLTYFELARLAYVRSLLGADAPRDPRTLLPYDFQFILAEVTCHYRSPATLDDQLVVTIWVSQVGRKSYVFEYRINDEVNGRLVAEGCSTQVWFDYAANESRPVPAAIVARMEGLQGTSIPRV
jgi:acyl-CoA thioester hydrolase